MKGVFLTIFVLFFQFAVPLFADDTTDDAWDAIKTYQYGDDFKPLLVVEAEVQYSVISPETQARTAARLASLLDDGTSYAGRQFVCMQLRLVGGAAEVPKLTEWLNRPEDAENARLALTDIPCQESLVPLRQALETFKGGTLIGVIGSLAARNDRVSIPAMARLLNDPDKDIADAAASALGQFGPEGLDALLRVENSPVIEATLIDIANKMVDQGKLEEATKLFAMLTNTQYPVGLRRAAFQGQLRILTAEQRKQTIVEWFFEDDPAKNDIAAFHLDELSDVEFDELYKNTGKMGSRSRIAFLELTQLQTPSDASTIPVLIAALAKEDTAGEALARFPAQVVGPRLLEALRQPTLRDSVIDVIVAMKYYDAIDPMIQIAASEDNADFVIIGLGRLCDPDDVDLPRLLNLYLNSRSGVKREKIERAIVVVCEKESDAIVRADKLVAILEKFDGGLSGQLLIDALPLLGKVGNQHIAEMIHPLIDSKDPALQQAAVRALCNWPNAEYLDDLWKIASGHSSQQYRQWALRAFIRVATLRSDRPESETLAMLQKAMDIAVNAADRQWCLGRAATIRTMETVNWAVSFLDDQVLSQTACMVIVELAHHRFLREPNKTEFDPILLKIEQIAKDREIAERAKKSRLGM